MRAFPVSLGFFVATAVVFALQQIPLIGLILMFMLAMFWSVLLINAGMIGTAIEALTGRVSRWWLVLPATFYAGYLAFAAADYAALRQLSRSYDAVNARVAVPFDPNRQALVFDVSDGGSWFVQNYRLPVAYSRNPNVPEGFSSNRMMAKQVCDEVRTSRALGAALVHAFGFHDGDSIGSSKFETRFCDLRMPERPVLPQVRIVRHAERLLQGSLPVTRVTTTIITNDGRRFRLLGGVAAPLSWIPMPVMGCALNSGNASWDCDAGFWRNVFTPIEAGKTRYRRDSFTLARALGLQRVEIAERRGGDDALVRSKMAAVEEGTLTRQLSAIDRMIADPIAKVDDWQTEVASNRPEALAAKGDAIMKGLERAAAVSGSDQSKARESGRILAQLIARLPVGRFETYGPRILTLYRSNYASTTGNGRRRQSHWLWESEALLRRLGDLGEPAVFVAVDPRASVPNVNGAGIETMCRIGRPGRTQIAPALYGLWRRVEPHDDDRQRALFVAMRRVGIPVPPLVEDDADRARRELGNKVFGGIMQQRASLMDELTKEWGDVGPSSHARVCSPNEWQARREERFTGKRRTDLI